MNIIISIKPIYVEKIFLFEKIFEYRKINFKQKINKAYIYSTAPTSKIVGEFEVEDIIKNNPTIVWEETKLFSGLNKEDYFDYYKNSKYAIALKIKNVKKYNQPISLSEINKTPPQSFCYFNNYINNI